MVRLIGGAIVFLGLAAGAHAQSPLGLWLTKDADAHVRIAECGGGLCGTIIWLKDPIDDATGKPMTDKYNPDPTKRDRPVLGLQVMYGMQPNSPGRWSGRFYNSDDGKTYDGNLIVLGADSIRVEGCFLLICMGETWRRVDNRSGVLPHRRTRVRATVTI